MPTGNNYCTYYGWSNDYFNYDGLINNTSGNTLRVICGAMGFQNISDTLQTIKKAKQYTYFIAAFDHSLWDYKVTRWAGYSGGDFFGSSGANVKWNIDGDGIGLFIGSNKKEFMLE